MNPKVPISVIEACLEGLRHLLKVRLQELKGEPIPFTPDGFKAVYPQLFGPFLPQEDCSLEEGYLLMLGLFPFIRPQLFDQTIQEVFPSGGNFPEFGGTRPTNYRGFLPTGLTALYLLAGDNLQERFRIQALLSSEHWLAKEQILKVLPPEKGVPFINGQLQIDPELVEKMTIGYVTRPVFSSEFPASYISTELEWEDLVLPASTREQIWEIETWLQHHRTLLYDWKWSKKFKPGYLALFYGPPGTGKTMTASLLGKHTGRDVYKVDLSTVVSKYIGETEKNLSNLFDRAENKAWILFFDEGDALFGKRTQVQNAHDRFANQEISYLLQRIEHFSGLVILATNFKSNIDDAFIRRFHSIIHFPIPKAMDRFILWQKSIPPQLSLEEDVDLRQLSQKFELTGASILNVVQHVSLNALSKNKLEISRETLLAGIQREYRKAGRIDS